MAAFVPDPNSSSRVNQIMRDAYDYLENTSITKKRKDKPNMEAAKPVRRHPIKVGKARVLRDRDS